MKKYNKGGLKRFEIVMIAGVIISLLVAGPVLAGLTSNTIDLIVTLSSNNRQVLVTGPIACAQGEKLSLSVILTQRTTGAIAKGNLHTSCTGDVQKWEINAHTQGAATFEEGPAVASALATTRDNGEITDAHQ